VVDEEEQPISNVLLIVEGNGTYVTDISGKSYIAIPIGKEGTPVRIKANKTGFAIPDVTAVMENGSQSVMRALTLYIPISCTRRDISEPRSTLDNMAFRLYTFQRSIIFKIAIKKRNSLAPLGPIFKNTLARLENQFMALQHLSATKLPSILLSCPKYENLCQRQQFREARTYFRRKVRRSNRIFETLLNVLSVKKHLVANGKVSYRYKVKARKYSRKTLKTLSKIRLNSSAC